MLGQGAALSVENDREIFICFFFQLLEYFHVTVVKLRKVSQCVIFHRKSNRLSLDPVSCPSFKSPITEETFAFDIQHYPFALVNLSQFTVEAAGLLTFISCW